MTLGTPDELCQRLVQLRGNPDLPPDASFIIPVNAKVDLQAAGVMLRDISQYSGRHTCEVILVINNYSAANPPPEIDALRNLGVQVVSVPSARRPGEFVVVSARALGVRAAKAELTIHSDADCRVPDINRLLDGTIRRLRSEAQVSYGRVDYYGLPERLSVRVKMLIHHTARWVKRRLLGVPTTQGANFAIRRSLFLQLYNAGKLSAELQLGPAARLAGARVVYSDDPGMGILALGREVRGGWLRMCRYFLYRLNYNLKAIPTRKREVTRASWDGFDKQSDRREMAVVAKPGEGIVGKS